MKTRIVALRMFAVLLAAACVFLAATTARAQAGASDLLTEIVTDHHGATVTPGVSDTIPEITPEPGPIDYTIPALTIDFYENSSSQFRSDRLHINSFVVTVTSDNDPGGLSPRTALGAKIIPASANEAFLPLSIFAHSDGENPNNPTGAVSDHLIITQGYYGPGTGTVPYDVPIPEPTAGDPAPEPSVAFAILPAFYDLVEPNSTGTQTISDYLDHGQITGYFISSDDPTAYDPALPVDGVVFEDGLLATDSGGPDPFYGGDVHYALGFASDTESTPEPASLVLLGLGGVSLFAGGWRRRRNAS